MGVMIGILFAFVVIVIAVVATASSKSPWDTVIAALAMSSQAGFAYMVYRLGRAQYAFTQQVSERQHKIDMYPLRKDAAKYLEEAGKLLIPFRHVSEDDVEAFRLCHLDISKLFSDRSEKLAFDLYEKMQSASHRFKQITPVYDVEADIMTYRDDPKLERDAHICVNDAIDLFTDLQNALDAEMRIR